MELKMRVETSCSHISEKGHKPLIIFKKSEEEITKTHILQL